MNPKTSVLSLVLFCSILAAGRCHSQENELEPIKIGAEMPAFELKDFRGKSFTGGQFESKTVAVLFFGVECPLVKLYTPTLNKLQAKVGEDLQIIGINSNRQDSITEIENFATITNAKFPLLKDVANRVADQFGATRTPQVFLFNADRKLVYRGAIDDQFTYGKQKAKAETNYLADAIESVLKDNKPTTATTKTEGCIIGRILTEKGTGEVTYANQVSRILNDRCVSCHRSGEVAPFSLTDYDEVIGWAEMIVEVVDDQRMPPWHANPKHGSFKNDVSLSSKEKSLLKTWVENGAPMGNERDLPEPPQFVEGWQIGKPDAVFQMRKRPYRVPATGVIPYKHFVVDPGFKEDKWIKSAEIRIGNRAVVHHVIVGIQDRDRRRTHGEIPSEWITAAAPGSPPLTLNDGFAKKIPAGTKLIFQMHYTPNGTAQTDVTSVGFKFVDESSVKKVVGTREIINERLRIPPGEDNHKVEAKHRFRADALVLKLFPHMHLRGKSFRYTAKYPDGESEILLDIPHYDFNWQNGYEFESPKLMPKGTVIHCVAHYDNSSKNFANPDPTRTVGWGDQTWDEMMIGYFDMALADQDLTKE